MSQGLGSASSESEARLREEVRFLRDELRRLTVRVDQQGDQLSDLQDSVSAISSPHSIEVVSSVGAASAAATPPRTAGPANAEESADSTGPYTWEFRQAVAREIGAFVKRSLQGEHRVSLDGIRSEDFRIECMWWQETPTIGFTILLWWSRLFQG